MRNAAPLLALALAGCGQILGIEDVRVDPDAHEAPDATTPALAGVIAMLDLSVSTPGFADFRGGMIAVDYRDLHASGGEIVHGSDPLQSCVVTRFAPGAVPVPVDAGDVVMSGPGLRRSVGPCELDGARYRCTSHQGAAQAISTTVPGDGTAIHTLAGMDFSAADLRGAYLELDGAGSFPIVGQPAADALQVIDPAAVAGARVVDGFAVRNGAGPIPTGGVVDADFIGADGTVSVLKLVDDDLPAFQVELPAHAEGFRLDDARALPDQFPETAVPVTYGCAGCGVDGAAAFDYLVVLARTTDAPLDFLPGFAMPQGSNWATLQCGFLDATTATVPAGAVAALLDTAPTRIEVMVARVAVETVIEGDHQTLVMVGHGVVGHKTF